MARLRHAAIPGIRRHKASGKAVDTLSGQHFYLGPYRTKVASIQWTAGIEGIISPASLFTSLYMLVSFFISGRKEFSTLDPA